MAVPPLKRILYVDDEKDIRIVTKFALESMGGFEVSVCGSGFEALETAPALKPDLILLDVMMPNMDGPTTLDKLRNLPATVAMPVVFMTAKVQPHEVAAYRELGAIDVIAKPFDPATLADTVKQMWARHHG